MMKVQRGFFVGNNGVNMIRELPIPPDAQHADQAIEVFRGWIIDGPLQCSLFPTIWNDDPGTWGVLLAEAANHIADAIAKDSGKARGKIYRRIVEVLVDQLNNPANNYEGEFVHSPNEP